MTTGELSGRVAVVTGGGRGIGESVARALARAGARVIVAARTETEIDALVGAFATGFEKITETG